MYKIILQVFATYANRKKNNSTFTGVEKTCRITEKPNKLLIHLSQLLSQNQKKTFPYSKKSRLHISIRQSI